MTKEVWKDIEGFEELYEVSNLGNIRSCPRRYAKGDNLNQFIKGAGYKGLTLTKHGKQTQYLTHRLVAQAFVANPSSLPQVNHIDGDKTNNCATNLEWCDQATNMAHARQKGLIGNCDICGRLTAIDRCAEHAEEFAYV